MMCFIKIFILSSLFIESQQLRISANVNNFGPYVIVGSKFSECKGPKTVNATKFILEIDRASKSWIIRGNVTFFVETQMEELNMAMWNTKQQSKQKVWTYKFKNPCQNPIVKIASYKMAKSKDCIYKKGFYSFTDMNLDQYAHKFIGNSFFYGQFATKSYAVSKKENLFCFVFHQSVNKV